MTMTPTQIKQLRHRLALSQTAFAERLSVSFTTVNRWENGKNKPLRSQLEKMERLSADPQEQGRELSEQVDYWTGRLTLAIGAGQFRNEVGRMLTETYERARSEHKHISGRKQDGNTFESGRNAEAC
jgi:transcriptional regulator with XRE-family HTH domain